MFGTVKGLVRAGLNYLGYDLHKLPVRLRRRPSPLSGGSWRVEFIGPSAIGKTTIYHAALRQRKHTDHWLVADELYPLDDCLTADKRLLSDRQIRLLELQFKRIAAQNIPIAGRYITLSYYYKIIMQDAQIAQASPPYHILLEEGILHNFPDVLLEMVNRSEPVGELFTRRAIIHCVAPPELIARRIGQRKRIQGNILSLHEGLTEQKLVAACAQELAVRAALAQRLAHYRLPWLELDMAREVTANAEAIRQFINQLT
jgi:hypothetical protein